MGRISFLVSTLLAFALAGTVLAAALLVGLFPTGPGGVSQATPPRSPGFSPRATVPVATAIPATPTATAGPSVLPSAGGIHTVRPGESLSTIGELYGVPWILIAEANGIPEPYVIQIGQQLVIPVGPTATSGGNTHIVASGETIYSIADLYDVDPTELADLNDIEDWNLIFVGQVLLIPDGTGATPGPDASP